MNRGIQYAHYQVYPETKMFQVELPSGDQGIAVTVALMRQAVMGLPPLWLGQADPQIRQLALDIVRGVAKNDTAGEIRALFDWVNQHIDFRGELDELIQTPEVTLKFAAGDCDDHTCLNCAFAGALGYQWDIKTVAIEGSEFSHVYARIFDHGSGQWVSMDTTVDKGPGWEPDAVRSFTWDSGESETNMSGWRTGRMLRLRGLGDDPSSGPSAADQISELILASTPIVTSAITGGNNPYGSYYGTPYNNPNYSQYGINVGVSTGPDVPLTQRAWFWPAIFGLGALAIWKMGDNRGRR